MRRATISVRAPERFRHERTVTEPKWRKSERVVHDLQSLQRLKEDNDHIFTSPDKAIGCSSNRRRYQNGIANYDILVKFESI